MNCRYTEQELNDAREYLSKVFSRELLKQLLQPNSRNKFRENIIVDIATHLRTLEGVPGLDAVISHLRNGLKNRHVFHHALFQLRLASLLKSKLHCPMHLEADEGRTDIEIGHGSETICLHCKTTQLMETAAAREAARVQGEIWDRFFDSDISKREQVQVTVMLHKRSWSLEDVQTLMGEIKKSIRSRTPERSLGQGSATIKVEESPLQSGAPRWCALGGGPAITTEIDSGDSYPTWFGGNGFAQLIIHGPPVPMDKHLRNQIQKAAQQAVLNAINLVAIDPQLIWGSQASLSAMLQAELERFPDLSGILLFSYYSDPYRMRIKAEPVLNPEAKNPANPTLFLISLQEGF